MEKFKLVYPEIKYKDLAFDYIKEFKGEVVNGSGALDLYLREGRSYEEWLEKLEVSRTRIASEEKVPSVTYFLMNNKESKIYGMINIRLALNKKLRESNGNIGYSIRPSERRKGYNKINLYLGLKVCKKHGLDKVMIDCDRENLGSKKTILSLGGEYEREYYSQEYKTIVEVYWINVQKSLEENSIKYENYIC